MAGVLRDLMSVPVVTLSPEDTLRDALNLFVDRGIHAAPVVAGGKVVGVLSATDILQLEAATPGPPRERPDPTPSGEWGPAPEGQGEEPPSTFFLESWEDSGGEVDERFREISGSERDVLAEHTVAEIMTRRICALPPDTSLAEGAAYMLRSGIHRVLVMSEGELLGIVSTTDLTRAVAGGALPASRSAGAQLPAEIPAPGAEPPSAARARQDDAPHDGYVFGPTEQGGDVGFRPRGVRGLDDW